MSRLWVLCVVLCCTAGCDLIWQCNINGCMYAQSKIRYLAIRVIFLSRSKVKPSAESHPHQPILDYLQQHGDELIPREWTPFGQTPMGQLDPPMSVPRDWKVRLVGDTLCIRIVDDGIRDPGPQCLRIRDALDFNFDLVEVGRCR